MTAESTTTAVASLDKERVTDFLRKGAWFGTLPEAMQHGLVDAAKLHKYPAGAIISEEGQEVSALRVVLEGQISVSRRVGYEAYLFHIGGPGFWFGELGMLGNIPGAVSMTARTATRVIAIAKAGLNELLEREPLFYRPFCELLVQRNAVLMRSMAQGLVLSPKESLRERLADIADLWRVDGYEGDHVELAVSQDELAAMVGVTRQYVGQFLRALGDEGLIDIGFRSVRILDSKGLRDVTPP